MSFNIEVEGGTSVKLLTAGKYCDRDILVTATGGGSSSTGGGSLPAAVYLSAAPFRGMTIAYRPFSLNGELYATSSGLAGSGYLNRIYKWNGTAWEILLQTESSSSGLDGTYLDYAAVAVEYHGKIHFLGRGGTGHGVFDGSAFTSLNATPPRSEGVSAVVYQDKLVAYFTSADGLYEWDESTDTWAVVVQPITLNTYTTVHLYVVNGELYGFYSSKCFRYVDGSMVQTNASSLSQGSYINLGFTYNGCIFYVYAQTTYATMYRYNPLTDENAIIADFPPFSTFTFTKLDNEVYIIPRTHNSYSSYNPCLKVNVVEAEVM